MDNEIAGLQVKISTVSQLLNLLVTIQNFCNSKWKVVSQWTKLAYPTSDAVCKDFIRKYQIEQLR